ncbi:MAG: hypothetical protein RML72_12085 [Bacteroidia bacterium]|nr:hypothetical protein [Bacteroidia bacterium]MDW8159597.1 hypothetical protein [Bacteroidia bacterium]
MKPKLFIILLTACILGSKDLKAQVGKGLFVGGGLGLLIENGKRTTKARNTNTEVELPETTSFSITPRAGYFFSDNWGVGIMASWKTTSATSKETGNLTRTRSASDWEIDLIVRHAKQLNGSDFYIVGDLLLGIGWGSSSVKEQKVNTTTVTVTDGPSRTTISLDFVPGILYFPTPKIGLEAGLGNLLSFSNTTLKSKTSNSETTESYNQFKILNITSLQFTFGLNYYFSR